MNASESVNRKRAMLRTAMGPAIAAALADPLVIEVMVNPDGALRLDRLGSGRCDTGEVLEPAQIERIIRLVASHARTEVHGASPIVSAELPPHGEGLAGERFEGVLPPVATGPCFSIRKPAARIYTLADYVSDGIMAAEVARMLSLAVVTVPRRLIAEAIDLIVFIQGRGTGRRIDTIAAVEGLDASGDYALRSLNSQPGSL
jgi:type IV secretion system protein VirB11